MTGDEIRQKFLEYFEKHNHKVVHSSPVYPPNDPTILFTNAGMNQFKDVFLGNEKREYTRAASSQKCIRAGGKHNDLDEVGKTARHHTFFEMLGNFSFGDYFKADAIKFAWDFLTGAKDEGKLGLNSAHLWFTYFEGDAQVSADTEARDLWIKMGAQPERVLPFDAKDNFWQMGDTGPCGPCSEIHYYMGDEPDNPEKNRPEFVNAEKGDETIEIWNLVFMQFNRIGEGELQPSGKYTSYRLENLPAPSVDTGAGLERIAAVMQGEKTNYGTDLIKPIVDFTAYLTKTSGVNYPEGRELVVEDGNFRETSIYNNFDQQKQFACRVIADHARTTAFSIADGILPGNEGRNYVLRKIMRRAIYHGREHLGFHEAFFYKVCDFVVGQMNDAYPELEIQREFIGKMVRLEEERFGATMTVGLDRFEEIFQDFSEIETMLSELMSLFVFENDLAKTDKVTKTYDSVKDEYYKKFSHSFESEKKLANFLFYYKIPPYKLMSLISQGRIPPSVGNGVFDLGLFAHYISDLLYQGTSEERLLESSAIKFFPMQMEDFYRLFAVIDSFYSGKDEMKFNNFKDFARQYDTYGIPRDLIRLKLEEKGIFLEEDYFNRSFDFALQEIQKQSDIGKTKQADKINSIYVALERTSVKSNFHGYDKTAVEDAKILALVKNDQKVDELNEGDEGLIVLNETPFYAESGGQVGDTGTLFNQNANVKVFDTFAPIAGIVLHKSKIEKGSIKVGDTVSAAVDVEKRDAIRRNHTATHLVHAALREVLGTHVKQAGSVVAPQFLRFDFAHYQPISDKEIKEIEIIVNREILKNEAVNTNIMAYDDAKNSGATALFGEKYGSEVRVLSIGDGVFSKELCGGTHVRATGDIGSFKILSDEAVASGVRRIRAITGFDSFRRFQETELESAEALNKIKAQRGNLPNAIEKLQEELKKAKREVDDLKMKIATGAIGGAASNGDEAKDVNGVKVIAKTVDGLDKSGMRHLSDTLMAKLKSGVVILARTEEGKVSFIVRVSDDLTDRVKAGKIVQEIAPIVGGRGGGKADMAEGGGTDATKLGDALEAGYKAVEQMLR